MVRSPDLTNPDEPGEFPSRPPSIHIHIHIHNYALLASSLPVAAHIQVSVERRSRRVPSRAHVITSSNQTSDPELSCVCVFAIAFMRYVVVSIPCHALYGMEALALAFVLISNLLSAVCDTVWL